MTTAALLLGGAACSVDKDSSTGGSTEGINTSNSRIQAVTKAYCEQYEDCFRADFLDEFGTVDDCIDAVTADTKAEDDKCGDAWLDYMSCATKLSCGELGEDNECERFVDSYVEACGLDDEDYASSLSSPAKRQGGVRKHRIPR